MRRLILILIMLLNLTNVLGQSMEWLCRPGKYSEIRYMGNDLFKVRNEYGKWGIVASDGRELQKMSCDSITPFAEDRALVLGKDGKRIYSILNQKGEVVRSFNGEHVYTAANPSYSDGLLTVRDRNGLYGYLDMNGRYAISPDYRYAAPFIDGKAVVQYAGKDANFGIIGKSGHPVFTSNTRFSMLSSVVDDMLFAVFPSMNGGEQMWIMQIKGNKLVKVKRLENKGHVKLSDDYRYVSGQSGHIYYLDEMWRISDTNYDLALPYVIETERTFVIDEAEMLSKHETSSGVQITYKGTPILEQSFSSVDTYAKTFAVVRTKEGQVGILKLNPHAGIDIIGSSEPFVFYHKPDYSSGVGNSSIKSLTLDVDMRNVNPDDLKFYYNDNGYLQYTPLTKVNDQWKILVPYFKEAYAFGELNKETIDIAVTYDGLDWLHEAVSVQTTHRRGYNVSLGGDAVASADGRAVIEVMAEPAYGAPEVPVTMEVRCPDLSFYYKGVVKKVSVPVSVPAGETRTFIIVVKIKEEGCPEIIEEKSRQISCPKKDIKSIYDSLQ